MIAEVVKSVRLLDDENVIVVTTSRATTRYSLVARDSEKLREFFSCFGLQEIESLDFDDKTGEMLDPKIVGLIVGPPQPRLPPRPYVPREQSSAQRARFDTPEKKERHGTRVWYGNQPGPKPPIELILGDLDQKCPSCGAREAASNACSACGSPTGPETWYDWREKQRAALTAATAASVSARAKRRGS